VESLLVSIHQVAATIYNCTLWLGTPSNAMYHWTCKSTSGVEDYIYRHKTQADNVMFVNHSL